MNILLIDASLALFGIVGLICCALFYEEGKNAALRHASKHVVCDDNSCSMLLQSKYYHIFYFPNWWYGSAFYLLILATAFFSNSQVAQLAFIAAIFSCLVSVYLIWALFFQLKTVCKVCYTAHATNALILITLIVRYFLVR